MSENEQEQRNLDLVRAVYEASFAGDANAFVAAKHNDFEEYVPPVVPWGGLHRGPEAFLTNVLPQLAADAPAWGPLIPRPITHLSEVIDGVAPRRCGRAHDHRVPIGAGPDVGVAPRDRRVQPGASGILGPQSAGPARSDRHDADRTARRGVLTRRAARGFRVRRIRIRGRSPDAQEHTITGEQWALSTTVILLLLSLGAVLAYLMCWVGIA